MLEYAKATGNHKDLTSGVVRFIYDTFPRRVEEILSTKARCDQFRNFVREFVKSRTDVGVGSSEGKVVVVGHSMFFRVYTTQEEFWRTKFNLETNNFYAGPDQCHTLMNCEVYPDLTWN